MLLDQVGVEAVVAGRHRSMRREDDFARNSRQRPASKLKPSSSMRHANRFEHGETAVSFVQVQHARRDAHRLQRAKTADAEQQLLPDAHAPVAAVEARRQLAIFRSIAFDVGIEQQQIAASDFHAPDFGADRAAACLDLHRHRLAVGSDGGFHRQLVDVGLQIFFLLPAVAIEALAEITLAVKQADADQRDIQIRRALDVIAGKHAEAAGIDRNRFVQAELGGKIGHRPRPQHAGVRGAPGAVRLEIFLLAAVGVVDPAVQHQFAGAALDAGQRHLAEQRDRIVVELPPARRIEVAKQARSSPDPSSTRDCAPATTAVPGRAR